MKEQNVFANNINPGQAYYFSYILRATTVGEFIVPPAKCEEIYTPDIFGTTKADFFKILEEIKE